MEITKGLKLKIEDIVTDEKTAVAIGSGGLPVYGTPFMAALMENCAYTLLQKCLPEGSGSVGTSLELHHTSASPVGIKVWAEAEITEIDGRLVTFEIKAYDEKGAIGDCKHQRFIIDNTRFLDKTQRKLG